MDKLPKKTQNKYMSYGLKPKGFKSPTGITLSQELIDLQNQLMALRHQRAQVQQNSCLTGNALKTIFGNDLFGHDVGESVDDGVIMGDNEIVDANRKNGSNDKGNSTGYIYSTGV